MKRLVLGLLVAATALTPVLAYAQEQRLERPEDMLEGLRDRPTREDRQEQRAERREERRAERAERRAEQAEPAAPVVRTPRAEERRNRRMDGDGAEEARPDGMFRRRDGQVFPPTPEQRRAAREERREDRQERRAERRTERQVDGIGADWFEGRLGRRDDQAARREERRDDRLERRADRRDRLDDRRNNWYGGDGFGWGRDTYGDAYRDGRVWNRGWRDDRRYDWNGYRRYNQGLYRLPRYYPPYGYRYDYRRFGLGATLSRSLFAPGYWIDDPRAYRLPPAYGPYRWVRYYDDALLIDLRTGRVVDMVYDIFF